MKAGPQTRPLYSIEQLKKVVFVIALILASPLLQGQSKLRDDDLPYADVGKQFRDRVLWELGEAQAPRIIPIPMGEEQRYPSVVVFTWQNALRQSNPAFANHVRGAYSQTPIPARQVSIAFAHENYRTLHPLTRLSYEGAEDNPADSTLELYYLWYEIDATQHKKIQSEFGNVLEYRLIIDGVWSADPSNPDTITKLNGARVSRVNLSQIVPPIISPEIDEPKPVSQPITGTSTSMRNQTLSSTNPPRTVWLRVSAPWGKTITVAGSFNNFDPYQHYLRAVRTDPRRPGNYVYEIQLRLLPGTYSYQFVMDGRSFLDDLNLRYSYSTEGIKYSSVLVR